MSKKVKKTIAGLAGLALLAFVLTFANAFMGNPLSKIMAKSAAEKYVSENYADLGLEVKKAGYNFKDSKYYVYFQAKDSVDTAFSVYVDSFGHVVRDDYEFEVKNNFTTFRRLDTEARQYGRKLFEEKLPEYNITSAQFMLETKDETGNKNFDEILMELEKDMPFDIHNPPLQIEASVWIDDEDLSFEKMAEVMLKMKKICEEENIPVSYYNVRIENIVTTHDDKGTELKDNRNLWLYNIEAEILEKENLPQVLEEIYNDKNGK